MKRQKHAFDYATAVTSNGLAVIDNYSLAAKAYDVWAKTGRWDDGMASGKQGKSMQKGMDVFWNAFVRSRDELTADKTTAKYSNSSRSN